MNRALAGAPALAPVPAACGDDDNNGDLDVNACLEEAANEEERGLSMGEALEDAGVADCVDAAEDAENATDEELDEFADCIRRATDDGT